MPIVLFWEFHILFNILSCRDGDDGDDNDCCCYYYFIVEQIEAHGGEIACPWLMGMVAHTHNSSTQEAETGRLL